MDKQDNIFTYRWHRWLSLSGNQFPVSSRSFWSQPCMCPHHFLYSTDRQELLSFLQSPMDMCVLQWRLALSLAFCHCETYSFFFFPPATVAAVWDFLYPGSFLGRFFRHFYISIFTTLTLIFFKISLIDFAVAVFPDHMSQKLSSWFEVYPVLEDSVHLR